MRRIIRFPRWWVRLSKKALLAAEADTDVALGQAQGDPAVVNQRKRRALRFHWAKGSAGFESLVVAIADAMKR